MKNRIKEIRKFESLTQESFANRLNLTRNYIAQVEIGAKEPSDRTIRDICREFGIREEWLRTGNGKMKAEGDRADEMREIVERLFNDDSAEFQQALISALLQFDPHGPQWAVIEAIFESVRAKMPQAHAAENAALDITEALHRELDRLSELEKGEPEKSQAFSSGA